jgi:hypothetical protein
MFKKHTLLKVEAVSSPKALVSTYKSTWCYNSKIQHQYEFISLLVSTQQIVGCIVSVQ